MRKKSASKSWQFAELAVFLEENVNNPLLDSSTVFLANPWQKRELDQIIEEHLWPAIIEGLDASGICISGLANDFPSGGIEDKKHPLTTRSLTFVLEDPERPISFRSPAPWFCRGEIACSPQDYMVSFEFFIHFPQKFSMQKILRLLRNPMFAGYPPELCFNKSPEGDGILVLSFSSGRGASWSLQDYQPAALDITEKVILNVEIIKAIYNLEGDYKSTLNFNLLEKALERAYAAY